MENTNGPGAAAELPLTGCLMMYTIRQDGKQHPPTRFREGVTIEKVLFRAYIRAQSPSTASVEIKIKGVELPIAVITAPHAKANPPK
jgi:hypothetical protein